MGPIGCLEMSVATNILCVTSQKIEDLLSLLAWVITFDLPGMGDPASSNAIAGITLRILRPYKLTTK